MDQEKISRVLKLIYLLSGNRSLTISDLADKLDTSRRTIFRYLDTFRTAGFVIKKSNNIVRLEELSPSAKKFSSLLHFSDEESILLQRSIDSLDDSTQMKENLKRKLYSVYDIKILATKKSNGSASSMINAISDAVEQKKCVRIIDYHSANSKRDRLVEPFAFTTNYTSLWCYDLESEGVRIFKLSRMHGIEILEQSWSHEDEHEEGFIDIFRMVGKARIHVCLRLGLLATNLIMEEYPLSIPLLRREEGSDFFILETDVADIHGVGRFVSGLMDDIEIIDSPELKQYLLEFWDNSVRKIR